MGNGDLHQGAAATVNLEVEGNFDVPAARLLENSIRGLGSGAQIHVDFARVRQFNDFAVAILAKALTDPGAPRAQIGGLRLHQVRMLRYFGVSPDVFRGGD